MTEPLVEIPAYLALGGIAGAFFFLSLRHLVNALQSDGSVIGIVAFNGLRLGLVAVVFWVVAKQGGTQLLVTFLGFMAARFAIMKNVKRG